MPPLKQSPFRDFDAYYFYVLHVLCLCTFVYVHVHVIMCTFVYVHVHVIMCTCVCTHACNYVYVCVCTRACNYVYFCVCTCACNYVQCRLKVAGGPGPQFHMEPFTTFLPSTASPSRSIPSTTNLIALRVFIMHAGCQSSLIFIVQ